MNFNKDDCMPKKLWCGDKAMPKDGKYSRKGTSYECLKRGFGVGSFTALKQAGVIGKDSLRNIPYVGEKYERVFRDREDIKNLDQLLRAAKSTKNLKNLLTGVFTKKNGQLDKKAYNATLLFLYNNLPEIHNKLPRCEKLDDDNYKTPQKYILDF